MYTFPISVYFKKHILPNTFYIFEVWDFKNVQNSLSNLQVTQGHLFWCYWIEHIRFPNSFLCNCVSKLYRFQHCHLSKLRGHVTLNTLHSGQSVVRKLVLATVNLYTKTEKGLASLVPKIRLESHNLKMTHVTLTTPFLGCLRATLNPCAKFKYPRFTCAMPKHFFQC